jgi:hypothetical protein
MNLSTLVRFLTYSFSGAVLKKKSAFVHSVYHGGFSFTDVITCSGAPNSNIALPGFKIRRSDLSNLNYDGALAQKAKEDLLNIHIHFCDVPTKRNAYILVFGSELLSLEAYHIVGVGGLTWYFTLFAGVAVQMKYLSIDFMMCLPRVPALVRD